MAVLVGKQTKLIVQGITGSAGTFHAKQMREYGTDVVGGVTPGKGGLVHEGFAVFDTVADAVKKTGANATVIYVPPPGAADAILEAAQAGIDVIAMGVVAAARQVGLKVPLVVRLEGTNVELGRKRLSESGLAVTPATDMADGARKIVALASGGKA